MDGEPGYDTTNKRFKIGDGVSAWNSLPYGNVVNLGDIILNGAVQKSIPVVHSGIYVAAVPSIGGPVVNREDAGYYMPQVVIGDESSFDGVDLPRGTLRLMTDYTVGKLGIATNSGTSSYDECEAIMLSGDPVPEATLVPTTHVVSGTTLTIDSSWAHHTVFVFTSNSPVTVTLASSVQSQMVFNWVQKGTGQITFTAGASATMNNRQSHTKSAGQWAMGTLYTHAAGAFVLSGDTAA